MTDRYSTARFREMRKRRLKEEPYCRMCDAMGMKTRAIIVDHVIPHRGNEQLFFDYGNTQSLCKPHHDALKQSNEVRGYDKRIGADGWPVDKSHPFYKGEKP